MEHPWDEPLRDEEFPDDEDLDAPDAPDADDADDEEDLVACPGCGRPIYAQAPQCPHCRQWVVGQGRSWRGSPKWYIRGGLYLSRVLLVNWLFWLALTALGLLGVLAWLGGGR